MRAVDRPAVLQAAVAAGATGGGDGRSGLVVWVGPGADRRRIEAAVRAGGGDVKVAYARTPISAARLQALKDHVITATQASVPVRRGPGVKGDLGSAHRGSALVGFDASAGVAFIESSLSDDRLRTLVHRAGLRPGDVRITHHGMIPAGRRTDFQPLTSGSAIWNGEETCTLGFSMFSRSPTAIVSRALGGREGSMRWSAMAGHCGENGTEFDTGALVSAGVMVEKLERARTGLDLALLYHAPMVETRTHFARTCAGPSTGGNTCTVQVQHSTRYRPAILPRLWSGGATSNTARAILGRGVPDDMTTTYCFSGGTSGEVCGMTIVGVNYEGLLQGVRIVSTTAYTFPLGLRGREGDSGAPIYQLDNAGNARVVGMLNGILPSPQGIDYMIGHTVTTIENAYRHLNLHTDYSTP